MTAHICAACGTWFPEDHRPPEICPICDDDRQYVPIEGQRWLTPEALHANFSNRLEDDDGILGIGMTPSFAINQRCALIEGAHGNIMWESTSLVTADAISAILRRGKVSAIAISHPHFYAAMHEWADALDCPIMLPVADRQWIQHSSARIQFWDGDELKLMPGVTLIRCGGHFPGSAVLHWQDDRCPHGALFVGDTVQVAADRKRVSAMHSYPNAMPLGPSAIAQIEARLSGRVYETVYGYTWHRNIRAGGAEVVARSLAACQRSISR